MGVDGQRQVVVDNRGQVRADGRDQGGGAGQDLQLTIDLDLQAVAELAMEGQATARVVALDPRTGEVLAMVSRPTFDPKSSRSASRPQDWKEIADNPDNPLLNRAIQAQQAPGSTFKPIVALAGLETGTIDDELQRALLRRRDRSTADTSSATCKRGHGARRPARGIVHSCDVYFYNVGQKAGDRQHRASTPTWWASGTTTGIDLPHEAEGTDAVRRSGRCATTGRSGMRARRFRWRSGRAR